MQIASPNDCARLVEWVLSPLFIKIFCIFLARDETFEDSIAKRSEREGTKIFDLMSCVVLWKMTFLCSIF